MPILVAVSLIILQAVLVLVHVVLYETFSAAFGLDGGIPRAIFVALAFTFIAASAAAYRSRAKAVAWFYTAAAYWFGLAFFLFAGAVAFLAAANVIYAANVYVPSWLIAGIAFAAAFLVHLYGTQKSGVAEAVPVRVALPNVPVAWRGKKIVFVSDLHLGAVHRLGFSKKIVRRIKAIAPELVLIGGDMYDGVKCDAARLMEPFRSLAAPQGVYFVTGNHDYYFSDWASAGEKAIESVGIRILRDEKIDLGGLTIAGIDYRTGTTAQGLDAALAKISMAKGAPSILVKHEPNHLEKIERAGASLALSGHTHQGQIFPLRYITRRIYRGFDYGLKPLGAMQVYTSSGVGTWGPPLRLGTKSEIAVIELANASS